MALVDDVTLAPTTGEWHNTYYNNFVAIILNYVTEVDGDNLADPFVLSRPGQDFINSGSDLFRVACAFGNIEDIATVPQWHHGISIATGWTNTAGTVYCKGDGTTDDTQALQRAIDLTPLTGQDPCMVFLPPGTYLIDSVTIATDNLILQGCGGSTVLKARTSTNSLVDISSCDHCTIRDIVFDGTWASKDDIIGIEINDCTNLTIEDCVFKEMSGIPIFIDSQGTTGNAGMKIIGCKVMDIQPGTTVVHDVGIRAEPDSVFTDSEIMGCSFEGYDSDGTYTDGLYLKSAQRISIRANFFDNMENGIIITQDGSSEELRDITISGNQIWGSDYLFRGIYIHSLNVTGE